MGLKWLDGESWANVTREERFFCMHLYNRIIGIGTSAFIGHLRDFYRCDVDADAEWEVAFEACFYRDFWHHKNRKGEVYSKKRTFDLAFFSDEAVIVLEAKAQQGFNNVQLLSFGEDRCQIKKVARVEKVMIMGLCSSKCDTALDSFDGKIIRWAELSQFFGGDECLLRADHIYEPSVFDTFGRNNASGYMTGLELRDAYQRGERFFVGRGKGGLNGRLFAQDISSGAWKNQKYETNCESQIPPNENWFSLEDFVSRTETFKINT